MTTPNMDFAYRIDRWDSSNNDKLTSSPRDQAEPQPRLRLRQCLQVMFGYRLRPATMPRPRGTSHCR